MYQLFENRPKNVTDGVGIHWFNSNDQKLLCRQSFLAFTEVAELNPPLIRPLPFFFVEIFENFKN